MDPRAARLAFKRYFQIIPADTEALRKEVYITRYAVYCEELQFENPAEFPDGEESDAYDAHSKHCLLRHKPSGTFAGCVRLVLANPEHPHAPFPFETACQHNFRTGVADPSRLDRHSFGEISRLAVTANFRRRAGERESPVERLDDPRRPDPGRRREPRRAAATQVDLSEDRRSNVERRSEPPTSLEAGRRSFPLIALGLYLAAASVGLLTGLNSVFVMMEPRLARHLRYYGIRFKQVGDVIDYHGKRGPFYITRDDLLTNLSPEMRGLLDAIQEDLNTADTRRAANP